MGELVSIKGRIGFRGYTREDIVDKDNGVLTFSPSNIDNNQIKIRDNNTYITRNKYMESPEIMIENNDILFVKTGSTLGKSAIIRNLDEEATINPQIVLLKEMSMNQEFLSNYLVSDYIQKQISSVRIGGAIPTLTETEIGKLIVLVPSSNEQEAIGRFFRNLDTTIDLHQRKLTLLEQLKQTYLQQMFPQDENNFPVLRIAGFSQPWVLRRLSDVSERVRGNDGRMDLPTLTISAGSGWLDQRERFSGNIAGNEQKNYTLLSNGELSYNHGNSKLAKYGVVFALRTFEEALVPKVYHSFKTTDEASADFVEYMFATKRPDRELAKLVSSGARMDGLLNINYDEFMGIDIMVPEIDEQNRISHFLRNFDDTILLHRCKIEKLTELKKVLLAKMFL